MDFGLFNNLGATRSTLLQRTCKKPTKVTIPQPSRRISGSTRIICKASITKNLFCFLKNTKYIYTVRYLTLIYLHQSSYCYIASSLDKKSYPVIHFAFVPAEIWNTTFNRTFLGNTALSDQLPMIHDSHQGA